MCAPAGVNASAGAVYQAFETLKEKVDVRVMGLANHGCKWTGTGAWPEKGLVARAPAPQC